MRPRASGGFALIKLSSPPAPALEREAGVLVSLAGRRLGFALPHLIGFSAPHGALAIGWAARAHSLHALQMRARGLRPSLAASLGAALASLHGSDPAGLTPTHASAELVRNLAWPSVAWYATLNPASLQFLSAVQRAGGAFSALVGLAEAAEGARSLAPVHGDFRFPNLLRQRDRWLFVDWELAGLSDPAVDVGSGIAEVLGAMVAPGSESEQLTQTAARHWLTRFWRSYRDQSGADVALAHRALQWAGEALLRRVYSQAHYDSRFDASSGYLIDAALELLIRPAAWRRRLLEARR